MNAASITDGRVVVNGVFSSSQGCCKVTIALRNQTRKRYIEMIRKLASGMSHICFPLSCKESDRNIVEHGEHFWRMPHAYLSMILTKGHIASMMEAIFNPSMASGQLKELLRSRYMLWETGHSVTNLCGGDPQSIRALLLQLVDLSQIRPISLVRSQQTTHHD